MNLTTFAPPFRLVGGYFIVGLLGLMVSLFGYFKADFELISSMETAGFIHLFLVGFVMSIIIGALYQLTSVIIEKEFFRIKFGMLNLAIYAISVGLFCAGLIYSNVALMHGGGSLLFLSFLYFLTTYLLALKVRKVESLHTTLCFFLGCFC